MKKKISVLLAVLFAFLSVSAVPAFAQTASAGVSLDGKSLNIQAAVDGNCIYLPVKALCEAQGYKVTWAMTDGISTVLMQKNDNKIILDLSSNMVNDNGHSYYPWAGSESGVTVISGSSYLESGLFDSLFSTKTEYDASTGKITILHVSQNNIKIINKTLSYQKQYLDVTIQYPQISGLSNINVQNAINGLLEKSALSSESEGIGNAKEMESWVTDGYEGNKCSTNYNYSIEYNKNGLLSVILLDYQYTGGAHGSTWQSAYTFDLQTGTALSLSDLMNSGSNYTSYFNDGIRKEIDKRVQSEELAEFDGAKFTSIGDTPAFYLSDSGVVFYFQQYEYFPYAAGIQEFSFNYSDLKSMLKQEYQKLI